MADRFLPADDPVLEEVLNWTVERDAQDIRRLLEWLPQARSSKERRALLSRVHELLSEVELSLNGLDSMHRGLDFENWNHSRRRKFEKNGPG